MRDARLERWVPHATTLLALFALRPVEPPAPAPAAVVVPPPIVVPAIVSVRVPTPVPIPVVAATIVVPPDPGLACPTPPRADDAAIGRPSLPGGFVDDERQRADIGASAVAPVIAYARTDGHARASSDDGRTFADIFAGQTVGAIAVDDRGRIYALSGDRLGVRDLRGRERWLDSDAPCKSDVCTDRIVAAGNAIVWIRDGNVRASADGGRTWRTLDDEPGDELVRAEHLGYWQGTLYGILHVSDMCGWEADEITTLELATKRYAHTSFDNDVQSPKLEIVDDRGATWSYRAHGAQGASGARDLRLASIAPTFGPRLLWAADNQLLELCGAQGRVVAHSWGGWRVDAVDAAGRPLFAIGDRILRWSAHFGWRELDPQPDPAPPARDGE
jgi:hypothetical protein